MNKDKNIIFLTGASGVGKTTLVSLLKEKYSQKDNWEFLHFDSIGVPTPEEMTEKYGSGKNWQKAMTFEWIKRMLEGYEEKELIIFEGQVNLDFIKQGFAQHNFSNYQIILIHCNQEEMISRLTNERKQPELANDDMKNWLNFLLQQAKEFKTTIIDTSTISKEESIKELENIILNKKL